MVKNKKTMYWKNLYRTILKTKARFISIFAIVFLGAAVFAGLRNTPSIMKATADSYLDSLNYAELTYISTYGFTQEEIEEVKKIEGVEKVDYGFRFDALTFLDDKKSGVTVYTSDNYYHGMVNEPMLIKGEFPKNHNECVIDSQLAIYFKIGEKIELETGNGQKKFTVTGYVKDLRYLSTTSRGTNTLGDGSNSGFVLIKNENNAFWTLPKDIYELRDEDVLYTQLSVDVKGAQDYIVFSEEHDEFVELVNTKVKSYLSLNLSSFYEKLIDDSKKELDKATKQYEQGLEEYNKGKLLFDQQILDAKIKLANAKLTLAQNEEQYLSGQDQANDGIVLALEAVKSEIEMLKAKIADMKSYLKDSEQIKEDILDDEHLKLEDIRENYKETLAKIEEIKDAISNSELLIGGMLQLSEADLELQKAKLLISKQENMLLLEELKNEEKLKEAKQKLDEGQLQLEQAQEQIDSIPKGRLMTLTRHENEGLISYDMNIESIVTIASVFPLIFFLVSALVSLTTMTRMVEEQRGQSGTLRALGYSKWDIIKQYVVYVVLATLFASLLGMYLGTQFLPRIVMFLYSTLMFDIVHSTVIVNEISVLVQTLFLSVFVTLFATLSVCISELNLMPAVLMRPKAPKIGKRIFLERIPFIWKRLSFNQKVTMRNIFRYKKRFFMSVIGIAGCTGLIITGFGIKYSVTEVVSRQYNDIFAYDALVSLEKDIKPSVSRKNKEKILARDEVTNIEYVYNQSVNMMKNKVSLYGYNVVYQSSDQLSNFIHFPDYKTNKTVSMNDTGVVLTQKAASQMDVDVGDMIDIELGGEKYNVKISSIVKNYVMNYIYMSQTYYEDLTGKDMKMNQAYMTLKKLDQSYKKSIEDYMLHNNFGSLSYTTNAGEDFEKSMSSLNIIIVILIVCAGALNFIVLYNLTNINIQERKSEIATIKVLGFRKKEVYDYIFRENDILSIIGSLVGIVFGYIIHGFIMSSINLEIAMFVKELEVSSIIISVLITILFTKIINFSMRKVLNKVDMVESLKSIE